MWQLDEFGSGWNDWCVQGGFTQDPSVPAAPLMEGFVLAKQEGVIRGQYMEAVAGWVCSTEEAIGNKPISCSAFIDPILKVLVVDALLLIAAFHSWVAKDI